MTAAAIKTPNPPMPPPAQKPRSSTPQREAGSGPRRAGRPATFVRVALSLFIVWHFTGVFLAALSIPTSSPLVMDVAQKGPMQWYLDATYMNQGHSFFAPDVGPGHLIRYQLFDQAGQELEHGDLPSRKDHWPRLLYHRYFMLADQSDGFGDDKRTRDIGQRMYLDAFAKQLLRSHEQAQAVRLRRYAHWPLPASYVAGAIKSVRKDIDQLNAQRRTSDADELSTSLVKEALNRGYKYFKQDFPREMQNRQIDDQGYELLGETVQRRSDLEPEANKQVMNWQNVRTDTASRPWGAPR